MRHPKTKSPRRLTMLLKSAADDVRRMPPGPHPASEDLVRWCDGDLPAEAEDIITHHWLLCRECQDIVLALDRLDRQAWPLLDDAAGKAVTPAAAQAQVVRFPVERFAPARPAKEAPPPLALAAQSRSKAAPHSGELLQRGRLRIALTLGARRSLVATLERSRRPLAGAAIALAVVGANGKLAPLKSAVTNENGEARLGSLAKLPALKRGERYEIVVALPPKKRRAP